MNFSGESTFPLTLTILHAWMLNCLHLLEQNSQFNRTLFRVRILKLHEDLTQYFSKACFSLFILLLTNHDKELNMVQNWEGSMTRLYTSPYLFIFCADYIMQNYRVDESQAGIKTAERNINSLRYAYDLLTESEEELKSLMRRVKQESEKLT